MITLFPPPPDRPHPGHNVDVVKSFGNFIVGTRLNIKVQPMSGRRYEPGKDPLTGKWLDTTGRTEDRYMVMAPAGFYGTGTKEQMDAAFNEQS